MTNQSLNDAANNTGGDTSTAKATDADAAKAATAEGADNSKATDGAAPKLEGADDKKSEPADADGKAKQEKTDAEKDAKAKKDAPADKKDEKSDKAQGAPEKYELKTAEGVKLAPEVQTKFEAIARELNLPQDAAQKLLDLGPDLNKMYASQLIETAEAASTKWGDESRADKEIGAGGDKAAYDENMKAVAKARNAFASPELVALLNRFDPKTNPNGTGLGNHPEVVRLFLRLGKSISEDNKLVTGGTPKTEQSAAQKLYAKTTPKT